MVTRRYNQEIDWGKARKHQVEVFPKIKSELEKALAFLEDTEPIFDLDAQNFSLRLTPKKIGGRKDCQKELEDNEFKIVMIISDIISKYNLSYRFNHDICCDDYEGLLYGRFWFKLNYQDFVKQK